jgi:hypothetical protein
VAALAQIAAVDPAAQEVPPSRQLAAGNSVSALAALAAAVVAAAVLPQQACCHQLAAAVALQGPLSLQVASCVRELGPPCGSAGRLVEVRDQRPIIVTGRRAAQPMRGHMHHRLVDDAGWHAGKRTFSVPPPFPRSKCHARSAFAPNADV